MAASMACQLQMHSVLVPVAAGIVYAAILASFAKCKLYVMLDLASNLLVQCVSSTPSYTWSLAHCLQGCICKDSPCNL